MNEIPNSGRLLGLDLGDARIGVAISDDAQVLATPYSKIKRVGDRRKEFEEIQYLIEENTIAGIVVGEPLNLDGSASVQTEKVRSETNALAKVVAVPVELVDERLSSAQGHKSLTESGLEARDHKEVIDSVAAAIILQAFIDC